MLKDIILHLREFTHIYTTETTDEAHGIRREKTQQTAASSAASNEIIQKLFA